MPISQVVKTQDFDSCIRWFKSNMGSFRRDMIEKTLLLDMMIKYIEENDIKALMKLVLKAVESTK